MKFFVGFSLVLPILGARVNVQKRSSPLDVKIESIGNSAVKASITNTGSEDLKVLKTGSLLDRNAVEKAEIFCGSKFTPLSVIYIYNSFFNVIHV